MLSRRKALKAGAALPMITLLAPPAIRSDDAAPFAERVVAMVAPATQEELMAALYLLTDLAFMRGDLDVPRSMTTREAITSGQLEADSLRMLATDFVERDLVEALLRTAR